MLEPRADVSIGSVLAEVEPVLDGSPVAPPLARPVQAHVLAPAAHLQLQRDIRLNTWKFSTRDHE